MAEKATLVDVLFFTPAELEAWLEEGTATFENGLLTQRADGAAYVSEPAVRIDGLLDGTDARGLVGRVWRLSELTALGAEHFQDSVIVGDTAYQCTEGFAGVRRAAPAVTAAPLPPASARRPTLRPTGAPLPPPPAGASRPGAASIVTQTAATGAIPPPATERSGDEDMQMLTDFLLKHL